MTSRLLSIDVHFKNSIQQRHLLFHDTWAQSILVRQKPRFICLIRLRRSQSVFLQGSVETKMSQPLKAAILIVSTTVANGSTVDTAGQTLRSVFEQESSERWSVIDVRTVPDDVEQIQDQVRVWTDDDADAMNLIVTTGGTGFAVSDQTPEVWPGSDATSCISVLPWYLSDMLVGHFCTHSQARSRPRTWDVVCFSRRDPL